MPMPMPKAGEGKDSFIARCMADPVMVDEYSDEKQRYAVCLNQFEKEEDSMSQLLIEPELRSIPIGKCELRVQEKEGTLGVLLGEPAIVYDEWSEDLGGFIERVLPGAAEDSLGADDIVCVENHDDNLLLGRVSSGTLSLDSRADGVYYACELPDTSYARDLLVKVGRGDTKGNSFRFSTLEDRWGTIDGKDYRELVRIQLYDVGPVTMPAYPQTGLALRSLFKELGMDYNALNRALLKANSGQQEQKDLDVIASTMEALQRYLPPPQVDPAGDSVPSDDIFLALRMRLELAERTLDL